jgi:hypothetical protein
VLAVTQNNTSMQTPLVLGMTAGYFGRVAEIYTALPEGTSIPPMVSKLV